MPTLTAAGRMLLLAAALAATALAPAAAQTFRLADPALSVDGRRIGVVGAPLVQEPFGVLVLSVPGSGTYRVATAPFDGARAVGQFDGDGLFFAVDGRSVRLRSAEAILPGAAPTTAFVRFDPDARTARGLARVAVADASGTDASGGADLTTRTEAPSLGPDRPAREAIDARADTERQSLLDRLAETQADRDALRLQVEVLRSERDALRRRAERVDADLSAAPNVAAPDTTRAGAEARRRGGASLPGFDFGRLQNPDLVRRRLDEAKYPAAATEGRTEGDVLVLFQTDRDGRVVRTAAASPIGGGLDGLAEALVREMRFVPPVVSGLPTGLRSQVLVRFEM